MHPGRLQSQSQGVQGHVDHLQPLRDALVLQPPSPGFRVSVRVGFPLNFLEESESGVRQREDTCPQPFSSRIDVSATLSPSLCVSRFALPLSSAPIDHPSSAVLKVSLGFQSRNRPRRSFKLVPRFSLWDHPSMTQPYFRSLVQQAGPLLIFKLWA